jgi:hypothetical protein
MAARSEHSADGDNELFLPVHSAMLFELVNIYGTKIRKKVKSEKRKVNNLQPLWIFLTIHRSLFTIHS